MFLIRYILLYFMLLDVMAQNTSGDIILEEGNGKAQSTKSASGVSSKYSSSMGEAIVNSMQRDPFYRVLDQLGMDDTDRAITDYELSDLTLVGVVWDIPSPLAMFKGPKGRRYILRKADRIGRNSGVIVGIDQGEVNIREVFVDLAGKKTEKTTIKTVRKDV
ncbi:MAG TPA: pilus assembly protein PilP [bacterium]|nr:pilus assembly protein PilP [bacterium]